MFACSERPCWVTVKDSIAEGKAVPGPARRRLPPPRAVGAAVCPHREAAGCRVGQPSWP